MTVPIHEGPLWLLGAGNMGGAMLAGWLAAGLDPAGVTVVNRSGKPPVPGIATATALPDGGVPATVLLAVKPQMLDAVAPDLDRAMAPGTLLVSILAGVELASLARRFPAAAIVRAMPNTPVAIGKGVVALHGPKLDDGARARVEALIAPLGAIEWIADEAMFDAVTALSGSGPAFLYRFVDALGAAGAAAGLDPAQAARMALATVAGAAALAERSDEDCGTLARRVASPGGSTAAGLAQLDAADGLEPLLARTIEAAVRRNREMADAAR